MSIHGINQGSNPLRPEGLSSPQGAPKSEFSLSSIAEGIQKYADKMSHPPTREQILGLQALVERASKRVPPDSPLAGALNGIMDALKNNKIEDALKIIAELESVG